MVISHLVYPRLKTNSLYRVNLDYFHYSFQVVYYVLFPSRKRLKLNLWSYHSSYT